MTKTVETVDENIQRGGSIKQIKSNGKLDADTLAQKAVDNFLNIDRQAWEMMKAKFKK